MASIKDTAATSALNEEQYINDLYDTGLDKQKQTLQTGFANDNSVLDSGQQNMQEQTDAYVDRTAVEAKKAQDLYGDGGVSAAAQAQVGLSQENARRRNTNTLRQAQEDADAEFQRQRRLLASQYEAAIRQAQADNDMARAQALYDAAKAEEQQMLELQKQSAALLAKKGDRSIYDDIANGITLERDTTGETWGEVLKNEDSLNAIYDAQLESLMAQLQSDYEASASDLEDQRQSREKQTDAALTESYVDALRNQKGSAELLGSHGQGSGTAAQGRLVKDIQLQDELTDIRKAQLGSEAEAGRQALELSRQYNQDRQGAQHDTEMQRIQALYDAAEQEEQQLIENQLLVGQEYAKKKDYSILGELFGLTPDQIDRLQGTGKYAPKHYGGPPAPGNEYTLTPQDLIWIRNEINGTTRGY